MPNDYVNLPLSSISGNALTLEAWVNPANITARPYYNFIRRDHSPLPAGWLLAFQNFGTILSFGVNTTTGYTELDVPINAAFYVGSWHHVAGVYDGTEMRLYVDCVLIGVLPKTGNVAVNPALGRHRLSFGPNNELFDGLIDEVRVWSVPRSQADLVTPLVGNEPGLFCWYTFDQGVAGGNNAAVTTLIDQSVNGNDGQLVNFALSGTCSNWVGGQTSPVIGPSPVAFAGPDTTICPGASLALGMADTSNGFWTYLWSPASSLSNPNVSDPISTPNVTTAYVLQVTDSGTGCSAPGIDLDTILVSIAVPSPPPAFAGNDTTICPGDSLQLGEPDTSGGAWQYAWSPSAGLSSTAISDPLAFPQSTTAYILQVTDTSNACAFVSTSSDTVLVTVEVPPPPPVAFAGVDDTICLGDTLQLGGPDASGGAWVYNWSPATGLSSPGISDPLAFPQSTTAYILQVTNIVSNCFALVAELDTVQVTVVVLPPPLVAFAGMDDSICPGETIQLGGPDPSGGAWVYAWIPAAGLSNPSISNPQCFPQSTTTYALQVYAPGNYCVAPAFGYDTVQVTTNSTIPVADAGPDRILCEGIPLVLHTPAYPGASYLWQDGITLPSRAVDQSGTYMVSVSLPCGDAADTVDIFFQPLPRPDLGADSSLCPGDTLHISPGEFASYLWQDGFAGPVYPATQPGVYTVQVTDSVGCRARDRAEVVACEPAIFVPTAFSPNGDGLNDAWAPVEFLALVTDIRVYDRWGKLIFASRSAQDGWDGTFRGNPVAEGTYTFVIGYEYPGGQRGQKAGTMTMLR